MRPSFFSIVAEVFAHLLLEVVDERLHHVVVEHLAELGLVPAVLELFGMGDRDVALGGRGSKVSLGGPATGERRRRAESAKERQKQQREICGWRARRTSWTRARIGGSRVRRVMGCAQSRRDGPYCCRRPTAKGQSCLALGMSAEMAGRDHPSRRIIAGRWRPDDDWITGRIAAAILAGFRAKTAISRGTLRAESTEPGWLGVPRF